MAGVHDIGTRPPFGPGSRPRVMYYSHSADVSGAEISLLLTVTHMHGAETVLVAPRGELVVRAQQLGIRVIPARSFRARMTRNPILLIQGIVGTIRAGLELRAIIRRLSPDIVHANSIRAGLISWVGVYGRSTRLVWHVRDNLPHNLIGRAIRWIARRRVNSIFAISEAIRVNFSSSESLRRKTVVVHNGIDTNGAVGTSIRSERKTPPSRFVVGVVGQIAPWKHQHDAIQAFATFHSRYSDSELWIVGVPKFRQENREYELSLRTMAKDLGVSDSVHFIGFRSDVMNVMASIDVLLVPSENEPFGRVVIEAMLAGKPVIGTRAGGIPEIVVHGETGFLVDVGDISSMGASLETVFTNPSMGTDMGVRGRDRIRDMFSIESKVAQIQQAYMALISTLVVEGAFA